MDRSAIVGSRAHTPRRGVLEHGPVSESSFLNDEWQRQIRRGCRAMSSKPSLSRFKSLFRKTRPRQRPQIRTLKILRAYLISHLQLRRQNPPAKTITALEYRSPNLQPSFQRQIERRRVIRPTCPSRNKHVDGKPHFNFHTNKSLKRRHSSKNGEMRQDMQCHRWVRSRRRLNGRMDGWVRIGRK